jgi:hypothetical protein
VLLDRCTVNAKNVWHFATTGGIMGPIVVLNCKFSGGSRAEGHQRWTTGMLVDNCELIGGGRIDIYNRGTMGSGHGWALAWCVVWNCKSDTLIQQPPGTRNWGIGNIGKSDTRQPGGTIDSQGKHVAPKSLYLAQLQERLGPQALKNIGY